METVMYLLMLVVMFGGGFFIGCTTEWEYSNVADDVAAMLTKLHETNDAVKALADSIANGLGDDDQDDDDDESEDEDDDDEDESIFDDDDDDDYDDYDI